MKNVQTTKKKIEKRKKWKGEQLSISPINIIVIN